MQPKEALQCPRETRQISNVELSYRTNLLHSRYNLSQTDIEEISQHKPNLFTSNDLVQIEQQIRDYTNTHPNTQISRKCLPNDIIKKCPLILTTNKLSTPELYQSEEVRLTNLGFTDSKKSIIENPKFLFLSDKEITTFFTDVEAIGIPSGITMINNDANAINRPITIYAKTIKRLKSYKEQKPKLNDFFENEGKIICSCPQIADMNREKIDSILNTFYHYGIQSPCQLLSKKPILFIKGLSILTQVAENFRYQPKNIRPAMSCLEEHPDLFDKPLSEIMTAIKNNSNPPTSTQKNIIQPPKVLEILTSPTTKASLDIPSTENLSTKQATVNMVAPEERTSLPTSEDIPPQDISNPPQPREISPISTTETTNTIKYRGGIQKDSKNKPSELTPRQQEILNWINEYTKKNGQPPTQEQIANQNKTSQPRVSILIKKFETLGFLPPKGFKEQKSINMGIDSRRAATTLTSKQQEVLDWINERIKKTGQQPPGRQIAQENQISPMTANHYIKKYIKLGLLPPKNPNEESIIALRKESLQSQRDNPTALTPKQQKVFGWMNEYVEKSGQPPTLEQIAQENKIGRTTALRYIKKFVKLGIMSPKDQDNIQKNKSQRTAKLTPKQQIVLDIYNQLLEKNSRPPTQAQIVKISGFPEPTIYCIFIALLKKDLIIKPKTITQLVYDKKQQLFEKTGQPPTLKQIAQELGMKPKTVSFHLNKYKRLTSIQPNKSEPNNKPSIKTKPSQSETIDNQEKSIDVISQIISFYYPHISDEKQLKITEEVNSLKPESLMIAFLLQGENNDLHRLIETAQNIESQQLTFNPDQIAKKFKTKLESK